MAEKQSRLQRALIGAHISISGGMYKAFERADSVECTTMQIFTKSNQQWYARPFDKDEVTQFLQTKKGYAGRVDPVIVHASYLINLCSSDPAVVKRSKVALLTELERCHSLDLPFLVVHPGSSPDENAAQIVRAGIDEVLDQFEGNTKIVLENMAGQGSSVGHKFEALASIRAASTQKSRIGFCIDTCHAFAAGYDFRTKELYENFIKKLDLVLGLDQIYVMHLNDSKKECGSNVDRHAPIGEGQIGLEPFRFIMNDTRLASLPKIIETPHATLADDEKNLAVLRSLIQL
jgi:deoxyribonuclease-4